MAPSFFCKPYIGENAMNEVKKVDRKEKGASLVEYALLVALIAVVAIAGIRVMGTAISTKFSGLANTISATT